MRTSSPGLLRLNFHHLQYFWAVATDGHLTRTAERLRVSQSAVSAQIRQLEAQLGTALFVREGRRLTLTESGHLALDCAQRIFATGGELLSTLDEGRKAGGLFRVGAVATLSRNFLESFVRPLLSPGSARLQLVSGSLEELLARLSGHQLDVVLSNRPVRREQDQRWRCRRLARQPVSLVGKRRRTPFRFPRDLAGLPLLLPGQDSEIRTEFDALCERLGAQVNVMAEVDDMATLRLLVRDSKAVALLPSVVVRDELRSGVLKELCVVPGLFETFYAVTVERQYQHPLTRDLLAREADDILEMGPQRHAGRRPNS